MNQKNFIIGISIISVSFCMSARYVFFSGSTNGNENVVGKTPPWSLLWKVPNSSPSPDAVHCEDDESIALCNSDDDCLVVDNFHGFCACPTAINKSRIGCWNFLREEQAKRVKDIEDRVEKGELPHMTISCKTCMSPGAMNAICENSRCKAVGPGYPDSFQGEKLGPEILEP